MCEDHSCKGCEHKAIHVPAMQHQVEHTLVSKAIWKNTYMSEVNDVSWLKKIPDDCY